MGQIPCSTERISCVRSVSRGAYYLTDDLAMMEHQLMVSTSKLLRSCGFRHFICPDTVKSDFLVCFQVLYKHFHQQSIATGTTAVATTTRALITENGSGCAGLKIQQAAPFRPRTVGHPSPYY